MSKYCAVQLRVPVRVTVLSNSTAAAAVALVVATLLVFAAHANDVFVSKHGQNV